MQYNALVRLTFLTSSSFKIATARMACAPYGIDIAPITLNIPEIQADTNEEIARWSALSAAQMLGEPVVREDHGFFLHAFPGWPGPYMAHTERIVPPADALRLLDGKDRSAHFVIALAYATPDGILREYADIVPCTVLSDQRAGSTDYGWDPIISLGGELAISERPPQERYRFFTKNFERLAQTLTGAGSTP